MVILCQISYLQEPVYNLLLILSVLYTRMQRWQGSHDQSLSCWILDTNLVFFFFFLKQDLRLLISANCQHLVEDSEQMRKAGAHGHLGVSLYHCGQMK